MLATFRCDKSRGVAGPGVAYVVPRTVLQLLLIGPAVWYWSEPRGGLVDLDGRRWWFPAGTLTPTAVYVLVRLCVRGAPVPC